ncbi:MAG TPA: glycosyltransferase [Planctomycetaceae bacterium]|nr:glycosyltransferase [Planctomycetaceae bacterium]
MTATPLRLLCIEPWFPGRLGGVADWLVRHRGYHCWFFAAHIEPRERWPASIDHGLNVIQFSVGGVARQPTVRWQQLLERGLCYAYGCWEVLDKRRPSPLDLVLGRSAGLGSNLFAPVVHPRIPLVNFCDYFIRPRTGDLTAEIAPDAPPAYFQWRRSANAMDLLDLENGTRAWTPTAWQRDTYPAEYRDEFLVLPDGIDPLPLADPSPRERRIADRTIPAGMRVVTFVASSLDRLRGFDRYLRLCADLLQHRSDVICIALGNPIVQHALETEFYQEDYARQLLERSPLPNPDRFWMLGHVPPATVAQVLAASDLHVSPSRPYPVSRSLLEALSAGCTVLAADEEPAREILTHGQTGLLIPADAPEAWLAAANAVLDDPAGHRPLGRTAAEMVRERYSRDATLPVLAEKFTQLVQDAENCRWTDADSLMREAR